MAWSPGYNPLVGQKPTGNTTGNTNQGKYQPSVNPLASRDFDPSHFQPKAFKDTNQGKKYKDTFSQADQKTRDTIAQSLLTRAKAGDKKAYDQLQAIKDVVSTPTKNPVKQVGPFNNPVLDSASNATTALGKALIKPATDFAANDKVKYEPNTGKRLVNTLKSTANFTGSISKTGYENSPVGAAERNLAKGISQVTGKPISLPGVGKQQSYSEDFKKSEGVGGKLVTVLADIADLAYGGSGVRQVAKATEVGVTKGLSKSINSATRTNIAKTLHDAGETNLAVAVEKARTPAQLKAVTKSPEYTKLSERPVSELSTGMRPENAVQTQFEQALNSGDKAGAARVLEQVQSPDLKSSLQSVLGTGEVKSSKLASSVNQKAVEAKLTTNLSDLPEYAQVNLKEQARHAEDLIKLDHEHAIQIASGESHPPAHILPESVFTAVENKALKESDVATLQRLASGTRSSEATVMGQRIRALAERDPESAVGRIQEVQSAKAKAIERKTGKSVDKATDESVKEAQASKPKVTRQTWDDWVESIKC